MHPDLSTPRPGHSTTASLSPRAANTAIGNTSTCSALSVAPLSASLSADSPLILLLLAHFRIDSSGTDIEMGDTLYYQQLPKAISKGLTTKFGPREGGQVPLVLFIVNLFSTVLLYGRNRRVTAFVCWRFWAWPETPSRGLSVARSRCSSTPDGI